MKIAVVKKLVENQSLEDLISAEEALVEEQPLPIEVNGEDEGEKLTHILAAIFILERMKDEGVDFKSALREYTRRVRESIS
ncbi:hypothetical protein OKW21_001209 [Catalinimonas alkaloidigena]|uniref:DUF6952 family protein n=1 Tax=Catalinimonas alkaloidigena TaxID=1075417 RepID=UPI002404B51E|nr:hypothetical protein [Catalinimonas alkaloidigena]MDF9795946.1 hypothetical protein [Catalinimonas alkaloidigena]